MGILSTILESFLMSSDIISKDIRMSMPSFGNFLLRRCNRNPKMNFVKER